MNGKQFIRVQTKRYSYDIELTRKITIIRGNSGTGKTALVRDIRSAMNRGNLNLKNQVSSSLDIVVLPSGTKDADIKSIVTSNKGVIIVSDENIPFIYTVEFASIVNKSENYFLIISRGLFAGLPYSIQSLCEIETNSHNVHTLKAISEEDIEEQVVTASEYINTQNQEVKDMNNVNNQVPSNQNPGTPTPTSNPNKKKIILTVVGALVVVVVVIGTILTITHFNKGNQSETPDPTPSIQVEQQVETPAPSKDPELNKTLEEQRQEQLEQTKEMNKQLEEAMEKSLAELEANPIDPSAPVPSPPTPDELKAEMDRLAMEAAIKAGEMDTDAQESKQTPAPSKPVERPAPAKPVEKPAKPVEKPAKPVEKPETTGTPIVITTPAPNKYVEGKPGWVDNGDGTMTHPLLGTEAIVQEGSGSVDWDGVQDCIDAGGLH